MLPNTPTPPNHFLATDASGLGWGARLNNQRLSGLWSPQELSLHSNLKEMMAILKVLQSQCHHLSGSTVSVQSDNTTVISYLKNEGGTKSCHLMWLTYQIFQLLQKHRIRLNLYHLPGKYNVEADDLSRGKRISEWHLLPALTEIVFAKWGTPEIDLFASNRAHVVPQYASLDVTDDQAVFADAFSQIWKYNLAWIFPPPFLIPRVLTHLNQSQGLFLLIVPRWEKSFWRPDLKRRAVAAPFTIRNLNSVLIDTMTNRPPPRVHELTLRYGSVGWTNSLDDWSTEQISLLQSSWRDSTKKSYKAAWRRWCNWAKDNKVTFNAPSGSQLAKFLADLHIYGNFSYNTILFHRSVVATLSNPNDLNLSSHPLVTRILKAISVLKPKPEKPPIWDIDQLSSWLCNSFSRDITLYECSRRTACLLLLCSGRRVHDLSLLSLHPDNFTMSDDHAIFWPLFGSKLMDMTIDSPGGNCYLTQIMTP
ncbi:hypothetical protein NE865_12679 [Phthorimaea operculella]|nr:hypothetical protein NE865_12679 [Phthorimaea operculella]